jgi:DNA-binding NarL/FixJ family response regulator
MKRQEPIESSSTKQITVLLAEDNATFRKSLKLLIEADGDIAVVGEAKNGCEAVRLAMSLRPDVIIMDIAMPYLNGLQATQQILLASPATRVLILSAHPDPEYIQHAMLFGASGYLIKQSSTQFLAQAVREAKSGNTYFSLSISKKLRDQCRKVFGKSELLKRKTAHRALSAADSPHHAAFIEEHGRFKARKRAK